MVAGRPGRHHGAIASHAFRVTGRWLAVAVTVLATLPLARSARTCSETSPEITVMTRNLYLGSGLSELVAMPSGPAEIATGSGDDWANVLASDFRTRAAALAEEVARVRPDVVGLQEVTLWRDSPDSDLRANPVPNATRPVADNLALFTSALAARGTPYRPMAVAVTDDFEVVRRTPEGISDVRITDRDVLLVRADRVEWVTSPRTGQYAAVRELPSWPAPVGSPRAWATIDYWLDACTTVRVLNTHLEVGGPRTGLVQERQAEEALAVIAASPHPVIAMGDFNAQAGDPHTDTYERLTAVLHDVWATAHPGDPGPTCCQGKGLRDLEPQLRGRVDLVLTSGDWPVSHVARTGAEPFRRGPAPVWASDHAGVTARIAVTG
jgi:endonuclease/exonuclease/phosphatase family metal-dependent hydrolase